MKNISNEVKSQILIDALPYIQEYNNKTVVIKYGGNAMSNESLKNAVMSDIVLLSLVGIKVILVHGGGPEINEMLEKVGIKSEFINGLRYTDEKTMDIVKMVLAGKVNKNLVGHLGKHKGKAIGMCGIDAGILKAKKLNSDQDLGYVGDIVSVDAKPVKDVIEKGYIPVIATVAMGEDGKTYNVNADTAASKIASEVKAENLILMTDIAGLLKDKNDESTLISTVHVDDVLKLKKQKIISGGMIPKVNCCVDAIENGVKKTCIIDGRVPHAILIELLSNEGAGTQFIKGKRSES